jgi:hypothetical protein
MDKTWRLRFILPVLVRLLSVRFSVLIVTFSKGKVNSVFGHLRNCRWAKMNWGCPDDLMDSPEPANMVLLV